MDEFHFFFMGAISDAAVCAKPGSLKLTIFQHVTRSKFQPCKHPLKINKMTERAALNSRYEQLTLNLGYMHSWDLG